MALAERTQFRTPVRRHRAIGGVAMLSVITLVLTGLTTVAAASTRPSGKVGPYEFSTAARRGASASCISSHGELAQIAVTPPRVKMRAYWTQRRNGKVWAGQWVQYTEQLLAKRGRRWVPVAKNHEYLLAKQQWKQLPAFKPFQISKVKRPYRLFHVRETLEWFRPTDSNREGSVSVTLTHYRVGRHWRATCTAGPSRVTGLVATPHRRAVVLAWKNPSVKALARIVVRYQEGSKPPRSPHSGHAVPLSSAQATSATVGKLTPRTEYSFAVWAFDKARRASSRAAVVASTKHRRPRPLGVPSVNAWASGTTVSWTVSVDPNGRAATVHVTTDHGFDKTYTTGTTAWTSPTESQDVGYSQTDNISVTVSGAGRASTTGSGSATTGGAPPPPPPSPSVSVSKGRACAGTCSGCTSSACYYIHVTTANFSGGVTCSFNSQEGGGFANEGYGANDSKDSYNYYGWPGTWVSATCGGVTGSTTW